MADRYILNLDKFFHHIKQLSTDNVSDGWHTFGDLYKQRLYLSAALFNVYPELAWKSRRNSDGSVCFDGGWFICGIKTPEGQYTYHYQNKYWDLFKIPEVKLAPEYDGHTSDDVTRLMSL